MTRSDRGFSTVEVVVAVAIATLTLVTFYGTLADALRARARNQLYDEALAIGLSSMSSVSVDVDLANAHRSGRTSMGLTWQLTSEPLIPDSASAPRVLRPQVITFTATDRDGRPIVMLHTIRLGRSQR